MGRTDGEEGRRTWALVGQILGFPRATDEEGDFWKAVCFSVSTQGTRAEASGVSVMSLGTL